MRQFKRPPPLRERLQANNAALRLLASCSEKNPVALQSEIKPKRVVRKTAVDIDAVHEKHDPPLERVVLKAIQRELRKHPKVAIVYRMQSGFFKDGDLAMRIGEVGLPDIVGMMAGGRMFGIEVKRPGQKPTDIQQIHLDRIRINGGLAGCAHSVPEALEILGC